MIEKEITIANIESKMITAPAGAKWKSFTVYKIRGNDGVIYETTDEYFAKPLAIGQTIKFSYEIVTNSKNGKIYTSNKISRPKKDEAASMAMKEEIIKRIERMEVNLIAAIKLYSKPAADQSKKETPVEDDNQLSLFPDDEEIDDGPEY